MVKVGRRGRGTRRAVGGVSLPFLSLNLLVGEAPKRSQRRRRRRRMVTIAIIGRRRRDERPKNPVHPNPETVFHRLPHPKSRRTPPLPTRTNIEYINNTLAVEQ